jgi:hypothetical protein
MKRSYDLSVGKKTNRSSGPSYTPVSPWSFRITNAQSYGRPQDTRIKNLNGRPLGDDRCVLAELTATPTLLVDVNSTLTWQATTGSSYWGKTWLCVVKRTADGKPHLVVVLFEDAENLLQDTAVATDVIHAMRAEFMRQETELMHNEQKLEVNARECLDRIVEDQPPTTFEYAVDLLWSLASTCV